MLTDDQTAVSVDKEIGLFEVFSFVRDYWKTIVGIGVAGTVIGTGFVGISKPQYEANVLVEMAQVPASTAIGGHNLAETTSVETPAVLAERLKVPSTYNLESIKSCGIEDQATPHEVLARMIRTSQPRNLASIVSITIRASSPDQARQCATSVFEMIRDQQSVLAKRLQDELRSSFGTLQSRLQENQSFILKSEKIGLHQMEYLARRIESIYLTVQIEELRRALSRWTDTRLISPVYAPSKPISRNGALTVVLSTIAGLALGVIVAVGRKTSGSWRAETKGA